MSRGAAQAAMRSATGREPVKATLSTRGWVARASPRVGPSPVRQPTTPGGRPARSARSQSAQAASGASWAGLTTTVQPAARAGASFQTTRATGKFHGVMARHHPDRVGPHPAAGGRRAPGQLGRPQAGGLGGEVVDHLGRPVDLGLGLGQRLALLGVHQRGDPLPLGVEQGGVAPEGGGPLEGREPAPLAERGMGRPHGAIGVGRAGVGHLGDDLARARGGDREPAGRLDPGPGQDQWVARRRGRAP